MDVPPDRPGRGTLRLAYGRSFEPDAPPAETFEVPVVVAASREAVGQ